MVGGRGKQRRKIALSIHAEELGGILYKSKTHESYEVVLDFISNYIWRPCMLVVCVCVCELCVCVCTAHTCVYLYCRMHVHYIDVAFM